jgi:hypothetical protein
MSQSYKYGKEEKEMNKHAYTLKPKNKWLKRKVGVYEVIAIMLWLVLVFMQLIP